MFLFSQKCPKCGTNAPKDYQFCPKCGTPLEGGVRKCGVCGMENRSSDKYCRSCGRPLEESGAPEIRHHHWARNPEDFAVRVETDDLPGLLKKGLLIEPGTNAMLEYKGSILDTVAPGQYTLETVPQKLTNWIREVAGGIPRQVTALLVDITPTEMDFHLGGRFTSDDLPIGISVRLLVEVNSPGKFLVNVLKSRERISIEDMRQYLYPEVVQVVDPWLRQHSLQQLVDDPSLRSRLELALEEALRTTFAQTGLHFIQARTVELNLEPYDKIKGIRGEYALLDAKALAELDGRKRAAKTETEILKFEQEEKLLKAQIEADFKQRWVEANKTIDLATLADETRKVEIEEQRIDLFKRMRQAMMSNRMDDVHSTADFEKFLDDVDRQKLLREHERADMIRTWNEEAEDHALARERLKSKLEIEQKFDQKLIELKFQLDFDQQKLESEIEIARKTSDFEIEKRRKMVEEELRLDRLRDDLASERQKRSIEITQIEHDMQFANEVKEAELGMKLLAQNKEIHRIDKEENLRIDRVHELERSKGLLEIEIQRFEMDMRRLQAEHDHEMQRIQEFGKLGSEALIALSSAEQGHILADLKKTEALKGMNEDQILAMAAQHSPDVAHALQEKFHAIVEGNASQREKEMYERLLGEQKDTLEKIREESEKRAREIAQAWDTSSARTQSTAERAMDRLADTASAFAKGQGTTPVIITTGAGTSQVIHPSSSAGVVTSQGVKTCIKCGRQVEVNTRFCPHCGNEFEGVG